jgi:hypothetical protein
VVGYFGDVEAIPKCVRLGLIRTLEVVGRAATGGNLLARKALVLRKETGRIEFRFGSCQGLKV